VNGKLTPRVITSSRECSLISSANEESKSKDVSEEGSNNYIAIVDTDEVVGG
jgi:hypothetical protein